MSTKYLEPGDATAQAKALSAPPRALPEHVRAKQKAAMMRAARAAFREAATSQVHGDTDAPLG